MEKQSFLDKLKDRWGITSNLQVLLIFIVFGLTGSLSVKVAAPILSFFGVTDKMNPFLYWPLRILLVFPVYQVLLICIGTVFGQFRFFWEFEKKMLLRMVGRGKK